ncbi:hypothetical protein AVEN_22237-1, partial [Araneus ventricosus]
MKSTRTRAKNDVTGSQRSEPIMLSDFLPQLYQGREPFFIRLRSTAQNIKVTRHKTRQRTTSRDKHTDKNDREAPWEKDGSSSATYHRKEKAADCNRYST